MDFKVGDRVVVTKHTEEMRALNFDFSCYLNDLYHKRGVIINNLDDDDWGIAFDEYINGHSLSGECVDGYGQFIPEKFLMLESEFDKKEKGEKVHMKSEKKSFMEQTVDFYAEKKAKLIEKYDVNKCDYIISDIETKGTDVVLVKFQYEEKFIKARRMGEDTFDIHVAMQVIMAKRIFDCAKHPYEADMSSDSAILMAKVILICNKITMPFERLVDYAVEMYAVLAEEKAAIAKVEETKKHQKEKLIAKKQRRNERRREQRIEDQKEAYVRAMKEVN